VRTRLGRVRFFVGRPDGVGVPPDGPLGRLRAPGKTVIVLAAISSRSACSPRPTSYANPAAPSSSSSTGSASSAS